jgi:hypothetical protein
MTIRMRMQDENARSLSENQNPHPVAKSAKGWGNLGLNCLLIFRRLLDVVDDQNLDGRFLRFQLEAELFLNGCLNR